MCSWGPSGGHRGPKQPLSLSAFGQLCVNSMICAHQDGGRLDDLDGLGQGGGHGSQLVPDLL